MEAITILKDLWDYSLQVRAKAGQIRKRASEFCIYSFTRYLALPGNADPEALPPFFAAEALSPFFTAEALPRFTRYLVLPGNADPEALPPFFAAEAEPLDIGSQAEPGNQLNSVDFSVPLENAALTQLPTKPDRFQQQRQSAAGQTSTLSAQQEPTAHQQQSQI